MSELVCKISKSSKSNYNGRDPDIFYNLSFSNLTFNQLQLIKNAVKTISTLEEALAGSGRFRLLVDLIETAIIDMKK